MEALIARSLAKAASQTELLGHWQRLAPQRWGYRYIHSGGFGAPQPVPGGRQDLPGGGFIRGLFTGEHLTFLDGVTFRQIMRRGQSKVSIDHDVSFDTNAASYLTALAEGKTNGSADKARQALEYLITNRLNYDFWVYNLENSELIAREGDAHPGVRANLRAIEIAKDIDERHFLRTGELHPRATASTIERRVRNSIRLTRRVRLNDEAHTWLMDSFKLAYCVLLKVAALELEFKRDQHERKLDELLAFMDRELNALVLPELLIAEELFRRSERLPFFGKLQKGHPQLADTLHNLAWDLQIIHQFERRAAVLSRPSRPWRRRARYYLPYLLTFDRRLVEVWDLLALRSLLLPPRGFGRTVMALDAKGANRGSLLHRRLRELTSPIAVGSREARRGQQKGSERLSALAAELEAHLGAPRVEA